MVCAEFDCYFNKKKEKNVSRTALGATENDQAATRTYRYILLLCVRSQDHFVKVAYIQRKDRMFFASTAGSQKGK